MPGDKVENGISGHEHFGLHQLGPGVLDLLKRSSAGSQELKCGKWVERIKVTTSGEL
jgi:hypothetical protein